MPRVEIRKVMVSYCSINKRRGGDRVAFYSAVSSREVRAIPRRLDCLTREFLPSE